MRIAVFGVALLCVASFSQLAVGSAVAATPTPSGIFFGDANYNGRASRNAYPVLDYRDL